MNPDLQSQQPVQPSVPAQAPQNTNDSMQVLMPTKNKPALFAYYFGVFGLIPIIGLLFSVAGVVLGIMGLSKYKTNPTPGAKGHALAGLILGIVELVIFVIFVTFIIISSSRAT